MLVQKWVVATWHQQQPMLVIMSRGDNYPDKAGGKTNNAEDRGARSGGKKKDNGCGDAAPTTKSNNDTNQPLSGGRHASLFSDDDSNGNSFSLANDKFVGDHGIVGYSAGYHKGAAVEEAPAAAVIITVEHTLQMMYQTLGLDSDSDVNITKKSVTKDAEQDKRQAIKNSTSTLFPAEDAAALPVGQGNKAGRYLSCGQAAQLGGDQHHPA